MKLKQLNIEIPEKDLRTLKKRAVDAGVPLKQYVINALAVFIKYEKREVV